MAGGADVGDDWTMGEAVSESEPAPAGGAAEWERSAGGAATDDAPAGGAAG